MPPVQNNQPANNTLSLPPVAPVPAAQPANSAPQQQPAPSPQPYAPGTQVSIADQAKATVAHYRNDPFKLSLALQQLKSQYLASHFGIDPSKGDK